MLVARPILARRGNLQNRTAPPVWPSSGVLDARRRASSFLLSTYTSLEGFHQILGRLDLWDPYLDNFLLSFHLRLNKLHQSLMITILVLFERERLLHNST